MAEGGRTSPEAVIGSWVHAPIHQLPPEILRMIFEYALDLQSSEFADKWIDSVDTSAYPWKISYVCHRWRQVAMSTPLLWTEIGVPKEFYTYAGQGRSHMPVERYRCVQSLMDLFMERSGTMPLRVYFPYTLRRSVNKSVSPASLFVQKYGHRFRELWMPLDDLALPHPPVFSSLTSVTCTLFRNFSIFQHTPVIQKAAITIPNRNSFERVKFPWPRLSHLSLTIGHTDMGAMMKALKACQRLVSFSIEVHAQCILALLAPISQHTVSLPRLKTLHVHGSKEAMGHYIDHLLSGLWCPTLRRLIITDIVRLENFPPFLERSGCIDSVHELIVNSQYDLSLSELLQTLPALKKLSICKGPHSYFPRGDNLFIERDHYAEFAPRLFDCVRSKTCCPQLCSVQIGLWIINSHHYNTSQPLFPLFFSAIEARWHQPISRAFGSQGTGRISLPDNTTTAPGTIQEAILIKSTTNKIVQHDETFKPIICGKIVIQGDVDYRYLIVVDAITGNIIYSPESLEV